MLLVFGDVMDKAEISHRLQSNLRRFYPKVYERLVAERRNRDGLEQFKIALSRGVEEGYFRESSTSIWSLRCCVIRSRG